MPRRPPVGKLLLQLLVCCICITAVRSWPTDFEARKYDPDLFRANAVVQCNVMDYGAKGDGVTKDTVSIQTAIDDCAARAQLLALQNGLVNELVMASVIFPSNHHFLSGPLNLTSNLILNVSTEASILGSQTPADYTVIAPLPTYPMGRDSVPGPRYQPLIFGYKIENVSLTGGGLINGQGAMWWEIRKNKTLLHERPRLVECMFCNNLLMENITFSDPGFWTLHPYASNNVTIRNIAILNPIDSPNTDGIDPDSTSNVLIFNSVVAVGDDCIAIKSGIDEAGRAFGHPSEDILIEQLECVYSNGISIGSGMFRLHIVCVA